jgi:GNAT superfamily N-acetyltransferase
MHALQIREAAAGDEIAIQQVVFTVLAEYGLKPDPEQTDTDLRDITASYHARGGCFLVVLSPTNRIVGCGGLYPLDSEEAEIRKMYLLAEARGHGNGRRILDELIARAQARGFKRIVLETASVLKEALALYARYGFVPMHREHLASRCDQAYVLTF